MARDGDVGWGHHQLGTSAGYISWGHQLGTPSADHQAGSLSTGFSRCDRVARRRPAQPLPPGNMEYGPSAGVRLLPTHQHMYVQEIFHDRARTQLLSQLQPTLLCSTNVLAARRIVPYHSWRQTQVYSVLENVEEKYTVDNISKIRKVQPHVSVRVRGGGWWRQVRCRCPGPGRGPVFTSSSTLFR